jgi:two-component system, chemotaxis family, response regulator Rcp1
MPDSPFATILIVDDSPSDVRLTQLWLRSSAVVRDAPFVHRGGAALAYLRREPPFPDAVRPHLILLDVHLPDMFGWEVLSTLRNDPALATIPVIMLTGTIIPADQQLAVQLGADRYLSKPFDADDFTELVREIETIVLERSSHGFGG